MNRSWERWLIRRGKSGFEVHHAAVTPLHGVAEPIEHEASIRWVNEDDDRFLEERRSGCAEQITGGSVHFCNQSVGLGDEIAVRG
jgi:hypothetical protein